VEQKRRHLCAGILGSSPLTVTPFSTLPVGLFHSFQAFRLWRCTHGDAEPDESWPAALLEQSDAAGAHAGGRTGHLGEEGRDEGGDGLKAGAMACTSAGTISSVTDGATAQVGGRCVGYECTLTEASAWAALVSSTDISTCASDDAPASLCRAP
jgi:hypothetical protein